MGEEQDIREALEDYITASRIRARAIADAVDAMPRDFNEDEALQYVQSDAAVGRASHNALMMLKRFNEKLASL